MTAPDVRLSSAQAVRLVAAREVRTRLRSKAFRISTAVTLLLLIGFAIVMKFVGGGVDATVGFTGPSTALRSRWRRVRRRSVRASTPGLSRTRRLGGTRWRAGTWTRC